MRDVDTVSDVWCGAGNREELLQKLCLSGCCPSVPGVLWEKKVTTHELSSTAEWRLKGQMLWPEVQSRTSTDGHHMLWQVPTNPAHPQHATNTWTNLTTFPSATTKALGPEADWHLSVAVTTLSHSLPINVCSVATLEMVTLLLPSYYSVHPCHAKKTWKWGFSPLYMFLPYWLK